MPDAVTSVDSLEPIMPHSPYPTLEFFVGNTPLVRLQRLPGHTHNLILGKLEGNNPAGSVKDRPALSMIQQAEARGVIRSGDVLIEATSGNTGIALAMIAAMKGYRMVLVMPENQSAERRAAMRAYGAELILVSKEAGMEGARDLAARLEREGAGGCWISSAIPTIRWRTTKPPAPKSGATRTAASPTSSAPWAPPAPSWGCRAI
jgi:cysteine synthase B